MKGCPINISDQLTDQNTLLACGAVSLLHSQMLHISYLLIHYSISLMNTKAKCNYQGKTAELHSNSMSEVGHHIQFSIVTLKSKT